MKNNIIIAGVPRAGKSTISHRISCEFPYQHVSMDSIFTGIEEVFPELGFDTDADIPYEERTKILSKKAAPFIRAMIESGEYEEYSRGMVADVYQLLPSDFLEFIGKENCDIFYFVTAKISPEERFKMIREYDTEDDYTFFSTDKELMETCEEIAVQSEIFAKECKKYDIPCIDTSFDRENALNNFMEEYFYKE